MIERRSTSIPKSLLAMCLCLVSCPLAMIDCGGNPALSGGPDAQADGITDEIPLTDGSWDPAIENLGDPGWRDSQEPWCVHTQDYLNAYSVWSGPEGVYVLGRYMHFGDECGYSQCEGKDTIFFNGGTGWTVFWEDTVYHDYGNTKITGIPGGPVIALSRESPDCSLRFIDHGVELCQPLMDPIDVFVVSDDLVYALDRLDLDEKLVYYEGSSWGPVPAVSTPYEVDRMWADEASVFCTGIGGTILSLDQGVDWRVHDTRTLHGFGAIWGFSKNDVWAAGGETWLMHYDGESWTEVDWPYLAREETHQGIYGMWGSDGILFFHTRRQLTMWDGSEFSVILLAEEINGTAIFEIQSIWGNSPTELFIAVTDYFHPRPDCGIYYLLWWDGEAFHWL